MEGSSERRESSGLIMHNTMYAYDLSVPSMVVHDAHGLAAYGV